MRTDRSSRARSDRLASEARMVREHGRSHRDGDEPGRCPRCRVVMQPVICACCRRCGATVPCAEAAAGGACIGTCFCGLPEDPQP